MRPVCSGRRDHRPDERAELARPVAAAAFGHDRREHVDAQDPGGHRVFEVVAHVGDAIGPRHHLTLRCLRCRQAPGMVPDSVEGLGAQVERLQRDVGTPGRMVEPAVEVRGQRVLAGMSTRPVPAVVPDRDRLDERNVQAQRLGHRPCHLGDLEGVGHARALVVVGEHEHLRLAGEPPKGRVVEDPVAVAFEAGAERVGLLGAAPVAGAPTRWSLRWPARQCIALLAGLPGEDRDRHRSPPTNRRGPRRRRAPRAGHRARPSWPPIDRRVRRIAPTIRGAGARARAVDRPSSCQRRESASSDRR